MKKEVVAIIPARGGSKGVPRKNIHPLGGKPLIAWSIETALQSGVIDRVVVSTDSREIAEVALRWGAEVPFLRPKELATDHALIGNVVSYTAHRLMYEYGVAPSCTLTLYPTHPFRTVAMLEAAVKALSCGYDSFVTVRTVPLSPNRVMVKDDDGLLDTVAPVLQGELYTEYYRPYGLVVGATIGSCGSRAACYPVENRVHLVDLDDYKDFELAEIVLENGLYDMYEQ